MASALAKRAAFSASGAAHPRVHRLLESDTIDRHHHPVQRQRHRRRDGTESTRPSPRSGLRVQGEEEAEQSRKQDRRGRELADVHAVQIPLRAYSANTAG
jgi:hypothetical protein